MASGNKVMEIVAISPPGADFAQATMFAGGSTPPENYPAWAFDDTSIEYLDLLCRFTDAYAGGGFTLKLDWVAGAATAGTARWEAALRSLDGAEDLGTSHAYDFNGANSAAPGTLKDKTSATITFTDGADMDGVGANNWFMLRLRRDPTHGSDDMVGDALLMGVVGQET